MDAGSPRVPMDGGDAQMPTADAASGDAGAYVNGMDARVQEPDAGDASAAPPTPVDAGQQQQQQQDAGQLASPDAGASVPGSDAGMDAAVVDARDAAAPQADAALDAGVSEARVCAAGKALGGFCWFLGTVNQSCNTVCAAHGGYEASLSWIGTNTQGGSLARCDALLTLLEGSDGDTMTGRRDDGRGVGCHIFETTRWWLIDPAFSPTAAHWKARIVCSCVDTP